MQRIILAGEFAGEIRVGLPVCVRVTVRHAGVLAARMSIAASVAAMRQGITGRMPDELARFRATSEIPAVVSSVAPGSVGVPMPRRALQFSILTIGDRPPSGGEGFLEDRGSINLVHDALGQNVNRCTQGYIGIERLEGVGRIHADGCDLFRVGV